MPLTSVSGLVNAHFAFVSTPDCTPPRALRPGRWGAMRRARSTVPLLPDAINRPCTSARFPRPSHLRRAPPHPYGATPSSHRCSTRRAKGWRRNQHLVDSLPYVDGLSPAEKQAIDQLIEDEVRWRAAAGARTSQPGPGSRLRSRPPSRRRAASLCRSPRACRCAAAASGPPTTWAT